MSKTTFQDLPLSPAELRAFFPHLSCADIKLSFTDQNAFAARLAESHDLTLSEAHETLEDMLFFAAAQAERIESAA